MNLTHDAMLVGLRIAAWSGRLYDRKASNHVAVHHEASASAGRYNKCLLPKAAFAALTATMSAARKAHYEQSLPWDDQGARLLTVANYERYTALMDGLRERIVRERARFIEDYEDNIDQARLDLGKLFRIEDYPSKEALQGKFGLRYRIAPVPDADHFMAKLASDDTDRVKRDIEHQIEERLHDAIGDLYRRLGEAVERVSERLQEDPEGKPLVFRDSMIENIRGLVDVVPRAQHLRRRRAGAALRAGEGEDRRRRAGFSQAVADLRPGRPGTGEARGRRADGAVRGVFRALRRARAEGSLMAGRVLGESAQRVSGCVSALLREQPFFGSLALRLPIRPDASRETVASDGREIRYAPRWIADTDAHVIETAIARLVLACALKHHTRRGERDPERWQRASQLVTHGLLRDAGFTLPPDAEAWEGISVEQAYDRLADEQDDGDGRDENSPSAVGGAGDSAPDPQSGGDDDDDDDSGDPADSPGDGYGEDDGQDDRGKDGATGARPSFDPSGTGEIMDAPAAAGEDGDNASGETPADIAAEEQAWDEAMHQALNLAKAQGAVPGGVEETIRSAHVSLLDWRALLRRYMIDAARSDYSWSLPNRRFIDSGLYLPSIRSEGIDAIAVIIDTSGSIRADILAAFWTEVCEVATEIQPERVVVLQVDAALQDTAEYAVCDLPEEIAIRGRGGTDFRPGFAWLDEQAMRPGVCLYLTDMECSSYPETEPGFPVVFCNWESLPATGTASPGANVSTSPPTDPHREPRNPRRSGPGAFRRASPWRPSSHASRPTWLHAADPRVCPSPDLQLLEAGSSPGRAGAGRLE